MTTPRLTDEALVEMMVDWYADGLTGSDEEDHTNALRFILTKMRPALNAAGIELAADEVERQEEATLEYRWSDGPEIAVHLRQLARQHAETPAAPPPPPDILFRQIIESHGHVPTKALRDTLDAAYRAGQKYGSVA